jgi:hypothetical protein
LTPFRFPFTERHRLFWIWVHPKWKRCASMPLARHAQQAVERAS